MNFFWKLGNGEMLSEKVNAQIKWLYQIVNKVIHDVVIPLFNNIQKKSQNAVVSLYIPNNITEVLLTDIDMPYTIKGVHDESMSLRNGSRKKMIKGNSFMMDSFLTKNIEPKGFTRQDPSLFITYTSTCINPQTPAKIPCNNAVI